MNQTNDYTTVALYARVSSDRQDVDSPWQPNCGRSGTTPRRTATPSQGSTWTRRERQDRRQAGVSQDAGRGCKAGRPLSARFWSGNFRGSPGSGSTPSAFKSMLRRKGVPRGLHHRARRRLPHGQAYGGHHRVCDEFYSENLAEEVRRGDAGGGVQRLLGRQQGALRLPQAHGAGRGQEAPHTGTDPATAPVVPAYLQHGRVGQRHPGHHADLQLRGHRQPTGRLWSKNGVHIILRNEAYVGTLLWGVGGKDKAEPVRVEKAFPGIVSKAQFKRVSRRMRSRAPGRTHPRRVGSTYLLSGLVRCRTCNGALSGQDAKSGRYAYYVCQSIMKRGRDACETPRLTPGASRRWWWERLGRMSSPSPTSGSW